MATQVTSSGSKETLVHYLQPALEDLRRHRLEFESYLLEMVILSLRDEKANAVMSQPRMPMPA